MSKVLTERKDISLPPKRTSTMLVCPAEGCNFKAKGDRALTTHVGKCKIAKLGLASVGKEVKRREDDYQQAKRRKISSSEHLEIVPEAVEPADVDLEGGGQTAAPPPPINAPPLLTDATLLSTGRYGRIRRLPTRYQDTDLGLSHLPSFKTQKRQMEEEEAIVEADKHQRQASSTPPVSPTPPVELKKFMTEADEFGRFRIYHRHPVSELSNVPVPDHNDFIDSGETHQACADNLASGLRMPIVFITGLSNLVGLFLNTTVALLIQWFCSGTGQKSMADAQRLIDDVILHEDFEAEELRGVKLANELKKLDAFESSLEGQGWNKANIKISVPCPKEKVAEVDAVEFEIEGLLYRDLTAVIKNACQDEATAGFFHTAPFEERWKPTDDAPSIRLYGEAYTSDEMITAYQEVQNIPPHPDYPEAESIVVELAPYSDATMLAQFGTASLWPVYVYFGNLSKYIRCQPSSHAAHHTAYFPSLPDSFSDWYREKFGIVPSDATITHCKRELIQALWLLILSAPDFVQAYQFGIFICFADQVIRRVFPRFFAYMADYPEKREYIRGLGTMVDRQRRAKVRKCNERYRASVETAREIIYKKGYTVNSMAVNRVIGSESFTPTRSAFISALDKFGLEFFSLFVVDLMHEFELGVWKAVLTHLLRILYTQGAGVIAEFDRRVGLLINQPLPPVYVGRFRQVPTFGLDTIRKFSNNVSAMKKLAARDFEDILQCIIPVIGGLLPRKHEKVILDLVFTLSTWHAYAKLRLHTDHTLTSFDVLTKPLGSALRHFGAKFSDNFDTKELPKEAEARKRQAATGKSKRKASSGTRRFNLSTYKLHALGDYANTIRQRGTTDSYSTQMGECEHRRVKRFYARTNHRLVARSISNQEARRRLIRRLTEVKRGTSGPADEAIPCVSSASSYVISKPWKKSKNARIWMTDQESDPLFEDFTWNLKRHALSRLLVQEDVPSSEDILDTDIDKGGKISIHKTLRINYTAYDLQRHSDTINVRTRPDIMVVSPEGDHSHPYRYGRLIDIFTVPIHYKGKKTLISGSRRQELQVLWVRWFERDPTYKDGFSHLRIPRLQFVDPQGDVMTEWHGFISPSDVLRATHIIPAFEYDLADPQPCPEGSHAVRFLEDDWNYYHVNIFVDRDMFMRYRGGGVGHLYMRAIEAWLTETGWGADDSLMSTLSDSGSGSEDGEHDEGKDSGDSHEDNSEGDSQDEASNEGDTSSNHTTDSDADYSSDMDPDILHETDGDDNEDTLDGEYGFTGL
ncbi:hypothetical protein BJ322DRAFT_1109780 [Thelephora terrestris]|uniref:Uncharacterized protein n=1 Tax=Thelephora terrestris TaxID=56493 RepID=A0A9P6L5V0_9AGAM|nr:hypothetical protein BJ322DRAFT_1109780 [Thelephora terrestris]